MGTSSPDGKPTGDLGSAIEKTNIDGRRPDGLLAEKLSPGNFRLLQQYRPQADLRVGGPREQAAANDKKSIHVGLPSAFRYGQGDDPRVSRRA